MPGIIPEEIGNLHNLQVLNLKNNSISGAIPSTIFNSSMIRTIDLGRNHLSGIPSTMGPWLINLERLILSRNQFGGPIPNSICNISQLSLLDLSTNSFSSLIPNCLGNLRNLQALSLDENFLTTSANPEFNFLSSLSNCKLLQNLYLNNNPLQISLPVSIGNLSSLVDLSTFNSKISGNIPQQIGNLSNLVNLNMGYNELTGTIPISIGRLQHLQALALLGNRLQGSIPQELCHLGSLAYLYLEENKFSGTIPSCLGNITSFRDLSLGSNMFIFQIPSSFWGLKDILYLDLSSNSLVGSLPSEIGNLKVLISLYLSSNQLSGDIPVSIGGLQSLTDLDLSENKLQGNIPQAFGDMLSLESLNLSNNNLSGPIPESLEKLLYLKFLDLSFNQLQGEIPDGGPFKNFSAQSFLGNKALCGSRRMQVPPCRTAGSPSKSHTRFVLRYILPILGFVLLVLASLALFTKYRTNTKVPAQGDSELVATWRSISYYELQRATDGFQGSNLLGTGHFGTVYKGTLSDGMNVAIKVFNLQLEEAFKSFDVECEAFRNLRHRNLVSVITSCCSPDFKAIVLEFMPNWSLEKWLYSHNYFLDLLQRLNIMIDVASALEYLHHGYTLPVVHCDLKPSNILLDEDMVAHVSDFGITKLLGEGNSMTHTMTLATIGYMAPEYGTEGIVSTRGDVYSYGILLMETFTRTKPTDEMFAGEMSLKLWVKQSLSHNALAQTVDANLLREDQEERFEAKLDCLESILELALKCTADLPQERMQIKDVVAALQKIKKKFLGDVQRSWAH